MSSRPIRPWPKSVPVKKSPPKPLRKTKAVMENFNRAAFIAERGNICECSECNEPASDVHHAIVPRIKGCPEVNDAWENLAYVNHFEHVSLHKFSGIEWARFFWEKNCARYGKPRMMAWLRSLPLKIKNTRLDFLTQAEKSEVMQCPSTKNDTLRTGKKSV